MGGRVDEAITVELNGDRNQGLKPPAIRSFSWRGERYRVESVGLVWTEPRSWWRGEGERTWFQLMAVGADSPSPYACELYLDHGTRTWFLGFVRC